MTEDRPQTTHAGVVMCLLFVALSTLTGCNTIRGFPERPRTTNVAPPTPDWQLGPPAIAAYNAETDAVKKKSLRNDIIDARVAAIDSAFGDYERKIYQEDVSSGVASDWTVLALAASTAVVGSATTKAALGAGSTAVVGATASFSKRALFDKTLPALLTQMVASREQVRLQIATSEKLPVSDYSWSAADSDLQRFAYAGSLVGAIASVTQAAGEKAAGAQQQLQDVKTGKFRSAADEENPRLLRNYRSPNGAVNAANDASLQRWMTENAISTAPGMISMFLNDAIFQAARAKAVKDLGLGNSP